MKKLRKGWRALSKERASSVILKRKIEVVKTQQWIAKQPVEPREVEEDGF